MHRHDTINRTYESRKERSGRQNYRNADDSTSEVGSLQGRKKRRQWQQEKHILEQLDPKALDEYLLDHQ